MTTEDKREQRLKLLDDHIGQSLRESERNCAVGISSRSDAVHPSIGGPDRAPPATGTISHSGFSPRTVSPSTSIASSSCRSER